jgi:hypothetical protein
MSVWPQRVRVPRGARAGLEGHTATTRARLKTTSGNWRNTACDLVS